MWENIAFYLLESGHTREAVLGYELPYFLGFMQKRIETQKEPRSSAATSPPARGGRGKNVQRKTMTSDQAVAKVRAQKEGL